MEPRGHPGGQSMFCILDVLLSCTVLSSTLLKDYQWGKLGKGHMDLSVSSPIAACEHIIISK